MSEKYKKNRKPNKEDENQLKKNTRKTKPLMVVTRQIRRLSEGNHTEGGPSGTSGADPYHSVPPDREDNDINPGGHGIEGSVPRSFLKLLQTF